MDEDQRAAAPEPESAADRRLGNVVLLVLLVIVIGGGIWLANAMYNQRLLDDCVAQGRRNCAPLDLPAR